MQHAAAKCGTALRLSPCRDNAFCRALYLVAAVVSLQFISNNNYAETRPSKIGRAENWRDLLRLNERRVKVARLKLYAEESARAGKIAQDAKVERQQSSR